MDLHTSNQRNHLLLPPFHNLQYSALNCKCPLIAFPPSLGDDDQRIRDEANLLSNSRK